MIITPKSAKEKGYIHNFRDENTQKQQAGFDLTLESIFQFSSGGAVDFDNKERKIADCTKIEYQDSWAKLAKGVYKITLNEKFKMPSDAAGFCLTRTTLLRNGAYLVSGLWDPGFEGKVEMLLVVENPFGIILKEHARVGQIFFIRMEDNAESLYSGIYKNLEDKGGSSHAVKK
ncbi:MAG: deoxyuridine 5'-triphosphate nucleotidohydrolase [Candidatus Micrarchaeota archaeon]|nr:deoxyuridine 5'-triphosphate nucleotidohydrolase [Candidatus Micrarchaeota archaeon]